MLWWACFVFVPRCCFCVSSIPPAENNHKAGEQSNDLRLFHPSVTQALLTWFYPQTPAPDTSALLEQFVSVSLLSVRGEMLLLSLVQIFISSIKMICIVPPAQPSLPTSHKQPKQRAVRSVGSFCQCVKGRRRQSTELWMTTSFFNLASKLENDKCSLIQVKNLLSLQALTLSEVHRVVLFTHDALSHLFSSPPNHRAPVT